jgi:hypothetical protein
MKGWNRERDVICSNQLYTHTHTHFDFSLLDSFVIYCKNETCKLVAQTTRLCVRSVIIDISAICTLGVITKELLTV